MKKIFAFYFFFAVWSASAQPIQPPSLLNVADGKTTPIAACSGCQGVVVIFSSLKCPYDQHYQERINALKNKYGNKVSFYMINSSQGAEEDESKMKAAYDSWGLGIPYLSDKEQNALNIFKASRTPEAILLKPEGAGLKTVYQGAIDDNPQVRTDTGRNFLDDAIGELVSGKAISVSNVRVAGCIIRKN